MLPQRRSLQAGALVSSAGGSRTHTMPAGSPGLLQSCRTHALPACCTAGRALSDLAAAVAVRCCTACVPQRQVKELLLPYGALKSFNLVMDKTTGKSKVGGGGGGRGALLQPQPQLLGRLAAAEGCWGGACARQALSCRQCRA